MILHAYSIYDRKALQYHSPFFAVADGAALRSFMDIANDTTTTVGRHPGDYVLYRVGSWDDASGLLLPAVGPEHVSDALPLVTPSAQHSLPLSNGSGRINPSLVKPQNVNEGENDNG